MANDIKMPDAIKNKYRFTRPISGGPVFDFPAFNMKGIDLSALTEQQAERLVRAGWAGIARVTEKERTPADNSPTAVKP